MRGKVGISLAILMALALVFTGAFGPAAAPAVAAGDVVLTANTYSEEALDGSILSVVELQITNNSPYQISESFISGILPDGAKLVFWQPNRVAKAYIDRSVRPPKVYAAANPDYYTDWATINWYSLDPVVSTETQQGYLFKFTGGTPGAAFIVSLDFWGSMPDGYGAVDLPITVPNPVQAGPKPNVSRPVRAPGLQNFQMYAAVDKGADDVYTLSVYWKNAGARNADLALVGDVIGGMKIIADLPEGATFISTNAPVGFGPFGPEFLWGLMYPTAPAAAPNNLEVKFKGGTGPVDVMLQYWAVNNYSGVPYPPDIAAGTLDSGPIALPGA